MKFETKMTKLGIDENEVKSIIANCECGEINGAYFIDLSTMRKWEIQETIGNYLDAHLYGREFVLEGKQMKTFCKAFGIEESEIADYYALGFNEGAGDIAYTLESNKDVLLVLTDDERYTNSFIQYSPSQQTEEESESSEESVEDEEPAKEGFFLRTMTKLDKIQEVIKIATNVDDAHLVDELNGKKLRLIQEMTHFYKLVYGIEAKYSLDDLWEAESTTQVLFHYENITSIKEQLAKLEEESTEGDDTMAQEEKWINFEIVSKEDSRIYLTGEWDITSYDADTDDGDWSYEQNDGTMASHIPTYWKVDGENLSFEFDQFIAGIDWDNFRQWLWDCQDDNRTVDCEGYFFNINDGAEMEVSATPSPVENYAVLEFKWNGQQLRLDSDLFCRVAEEIDDIFDGSESYFFENGCIIREVGKHYFDDSEFYVSERKSLESDFCEIARRYLAQQFTRNLGIYAKYGDLMEQAMDEEYDDEWLRKLSAVNDSNLHLFLCDEGLIDELCEQE